MCAKLQKKNEVRNRTNNEVNSVASLQVEEVYKRQDERSEVMRNEKHTVDDKIDRRKCKKETKRGQTVQTMAMQINDAVHRIVC